MNTAAGSIKRNGIFTIGAYRGQLIRRIQCGGEQLYYVGNDIHHTYASAEQCRAAIDTAPAARCG